MSDICPYQKAMLEAAAYYDELKGEDFEQAMEEKSNEVRYQQRNPPCGKCSECQADHRTREKPVDTSEMYEDDIDF